MISIQPALIYKSLGDISSEGLRGINPFEMLSQGSSYKISPARSKSREKPCIPAWIEK
jgi:hypothetical protein